LTVVISHSLFSSALTCENTPELEGSGSVFPPRQLGISIIIKIKDVFLGLGWFSLSNVSSLSTSIPMLTKQVSFYLSLLNNGSSGEYHAVDSHC